MHHLIGAPQFGIFVLERIETVWACGDDLLHLVAIEDLDVHGCRHLEKQFVSRPFRRITRTTLLCSKHGKFYSSLVQKFDKGFGDLFGAVVETTGTTYPEQHLGALVLGQAFGHGRDFDRLTHNLALIVEYFDGHLFFHQVSELTTVTCCPYKVIVDPVVITSSWLTHKQ